MPGSIGTEDAWMRLVAWDYEKSGLAHGSEKEHARYARAPFFVLRGCPKLCEQPGQKRAVVLRSWLLGRSCCEIQTLQPIVTPFF